MDLNENGSDGRRIRWLWIGLGTQLLIFVNAARYLPAVPYQAFIVGALINAGMVIAFVVALRKAYRDRKQPNSTACM
jgi:hypothetical protein